MWKPSQAYERDMLGDRLVQGSTSAVKPNEKLALEKPE